MHPRTLLQIQNPSRISLDEANCTVFCTPTCQLRCSVDSEPPPPPPSPPPPRPHSHNVSPWWIVGIMIFIILVFVSCVVVVIRRWRFQVGAGRTQPARSNASERPEVEDVIDDHGGDDPLDGNPVWLIATVGLSERVMNRITVVRYKDGEGLIDGTGCSVCLSEFRDGESLRVLPKCDHAFHIECIDTWLRSHTNCPLCRSAIVLSPGRPSLGSNIDQSFGHSRRSELIMVGDAEITGDVELGNDLVGSYGVDVNDSFSEGRGIDSSGALSQNKLDSL